MVITYANKQRWYKELRENPLDGFGGNAQSKIKSTLKKIHFYGIEAKIRPLTRELLNEFLPIYEKEIMRKNNPRIFNVEDKTLGKASSGYPYFYLSLTENDHVLGGTIFSEKPDTLSVSYRAYGANWRHATLQAKPALYAEYVLAKKALSLGKARISHGRDRNPYGLNANIGLAAFKLSIGCRPYVPEDFELNVIDTDTIKTDALILQYPDNGENRISKAFLVTAAETEQKWLQVTKYPEALRVEIIRS